MLLGHRLSLGRAAGPCGGRAGLAGRDHQVVEDRRREARLEQAAVELLQASSPGMRTGARPRGPPRGRPSPRASCWSSRTSWPAAPRRGPGRRRRRRRRRRLELAGSERVDVDDALERLIRRSSPSAGRARRRAHAPQRGDAPANAWVACEPVAVARGLAGEQRPCRRAPGRARTPRTRAGDRVCGEGRRARDEVEALVRERQALGVGGLRAHLPARVAAALAGSVLEHPGEMSLQVASPISPGAQEVEGEVAGAGADLERAASQRSGSPPSALRSLVVTWPAPTLAEVDAPLRVVVVGGHVVVAGVCVADLLGAEGGRHGAAPYTRAPCPAPPTPEPPSGLLSLTASLYVQRDQPEGVPPLALTGERTLPNVRRRTTGSAVTWPSTSGSRRGSAI